MEKSYTRLCRMRSGVWRVAGEVSLGVIARGGTCLGLRMTASESKTCLFICLLWCCLYVNIVYVSVGVKMPPTESKTLSRVKSIEIETRLKKIKIKQKKKK